MTELIAYCGLDCAQCEAYKYTQSNDMEGKQRLLQQWRIQYNSPEMGLDAVTCDGCTSGERLGGYCSQCPVHACSRERGLPHCGACPDYLCEQLEGLFSMAPQMRENLERLRSAAN